MNDNCKTFEIALIQSREPGFPTSEKAKLEEHLSTCRSCHEMASEMESLDALLATSRGTQEVPGTAANGWAKAERAAKIQKTRMDQYGRRSKLAVGVGLTIAAFGLMLDSWIWIQGVGVMIYGLGLLVYVQKAGNSLNELASSDAELLRMHRRSLDRQLRCCWGGALLALVLSLPWFLGMFIELPAIFLSLGFRRVGGFGGMVGASLLALAMYFLFKVGPALVRERREFA